MEKGKKKLNPILSAITYAFDFVYSLLLIYSKFVLLVIVFLVSAEVISRKFLGGSIRWSEEVALFGMVWMAFISMAIGVQKGLHIALGFFFSLLPKKVAYVVDKLDNLVVMFFGCFMVYYGSKLVAGTMTSYLPATHWPSGLEYLMIPVSGVFIVYFSLMNIFELKDYEHEKFYQDYEEDESDTDDTEKGGEA